MTARRQLRRYHIWLGWIVGLPLAIWTVTGLFMVSQPIEKVRGEHLLAEAPSLPNGLRPVAPAIGPRAVASILLEQRRDGPRWVVRYADGGERLADGRTGRLLPPLNAADAAAAVSARYTGEARVAAIQRIPADAPPIELRRNVASWRVSMDDGTRFFVDSATGEIIARRTGLWRVYDFMWGLHILDPVTRENLNSPWLIALAAVAAISVLMALALLPLTLRRRE